MSAAQTETKKDQQTSVLNRLRTLVAEGAKNALAQIVLVKDELVPLYDSPLPDKFYNDVAKVTGWSKGTTDQRLKSLAFIRTLEGPARAKVEAWPIDTVAPVATLTVKGEDGEDEDATAKAREQLVKAFANPPVRQDQVRDKREKLGYGSTRTTATPEDKAEKLADAIAPKVREHLAGSPTRAQSILFGINLQAEHKGKDVGAAAQLLFSRMIAEQEAAKAAAS